MIDEDRTYENEVRFNNDRLGGRKIGKDRINISIGLGEYRYTENIQKERK